MRCCKRVEVYDVQQHSRVSRTMAAESALDAEIADLEAKLQAKKTERGNARVRDSRAS